MKSNLNGLKPELSQVPVVILAGGNGIYVDDSGIRKAKGEVLVLGKPLIAHVIKSYLDAGFRKFIISGGYRLDVQIQQLKVNFLLSENSKANFTGAIGKDIFHIQFIDSGAEASTGERLMAAKEALADAPRFCMTYSDTISTVNLKQIYSWHLKNKKIVTLTAVKLPTRFRVLGIRSGETLIRGFADKTFMPTHSINGGFYVIEANLWPYFKLASAKPVFEKNILELLMERGELESFPFTGSWQYVDSERDLKTLEFIAQEIQNAAL